MFMFSTALTVVNIFKIHTAWRFKMAYLCSGSKEWLKSRSRLAIWIH